MKKLMIAAAFVGAAVVSQAAAVNWKVSGASGDVGKKVYLIVGDTVKTDWTSASEVVGAAALGGSGTIAKSSRVYVADGTANDSNITKTSSFYYVIVDGDQFAVSGLYSGSDWVYDPTAQPPENPPAGNPVFSAAGASYSKFSGGPTPVIPEPTSGLLLLLGVAGLALRRKQK